MIQFELKDVYTVGGVIVGETTSTQRVNIRAGVIGLPDEDKYKLPEFTEIYEFSNNLSITEAKDGMVTFAAEWVAINYPSI